MTPFDLSTRRRRARGVTVFPWPLAAAGLLLLASAGCCCHQGNACNPSPCAPGPYGYNSPGYAAGSTAYGTAFAAPAETALLPNEPLQKY